jgi:glycosyltransferase involved in cell wall biosynthesis
MSDVQGETMRGSPIKKGGSVLFILKGYPRLSETFIAQEIRGLERRGLSIEIWSLRHPTDRKTHPIHREIEAPVRYLPEYLHHEPLRVFRGWWRVRRRPGYRAARRLWGRDFKRDRSRNRLRRFGQALVLAAEMPAGTERLHAHFMHTPASVARYAAAITGLPWSCSAHAKDIWTSPEWEKREKLQGTEWLVTCTEFGFQHLRALSADPDKVALSYHGLDFDRFPEPDRADRPVGKSTYADDQSVMLLSVGRAVEKKGFDILLKALAQLPSDLSWRWQHVGGGELLNQLKAQAKELGIDGKIDWLGAQDQSALMPLYRDADMFVLPSRIAGDGDRDGLPNVLMEAQSQKLACISTAISGIPELIENEHTGLLIPPDDVTALTSALLRFIRDPAERTAMAEAGFKRLRAHFSAAAELDLLGQRFGLQPLNPDLGHTPNLSGTRSQKAD